MSPTFAISANSATAISGQTITYTITTTNVPDGSTLYLTESGTATGSNFVDGLTQIPVTITSNSGTVTRKTVYSNSSASATSILQLRTGGYSGTIQTTASTVTVYNTTYTFTSPATVS